MPRPILLRKDTYLRSRWKNGLGYTDQIAIEPADADLRLGNYLWRISSASIENASDFSLFPDHDRALMVLSGAGLRLFHQDVEHDFDDTIELPPFEPYEFPGDIKSRCELVDGPVQDLSIFHRKGVVGASIEVIRFDGETTWDWAPQGQWSFLFAARGKFEVAVTDSEMESLQTGDSLRSDLGTSSYLESFPVAAHEANSIALAICLWKN